MHYTRTYYPYMKHFQEGRQIIFNAYSHEKIRREKLPAAVFKLSRNHLDIILLSLSRRSAITVAVISTNHTITSIASTISA